MKKKVTKKSVPPFKATVTFGLQKHYTEEIIPKEAIFREIHTYQKRMLDEKKFYLSIAVSETLILLNSQREPHLVFNFINYPLSPLPVQELKQHIEQFVEHLMTLFQQNRVVIEYLDETTMLEFSSDIDPKILQ